MSVSECQRDTWLTRPTISKYYKYLRNRISDFMQQMYEDDGPMKLEEFPEIQDPDMDSEEINNWEVALTVEVDEMLLSHFAGEGRRHIRQI